MPIPFKINAAAPKELTGKWLFSRIFFLSCPLVPLISNQLADTYSFFIFSLKTVLSLDVDSVVPAHGEVENNKMGGFSQGI
jgi:hypothetical protein